MTVYIPVGKRTSPFRSLLYIRSMIFGLARLIVFFSLCRIPIQKRCSTALIRTEPLISLPIKLRHIHKMTSQRYPQLIPSSQLHFDHIRNTPPQQPNLPSSLSPTSPSPPPSSPSSPETPTGPPTKIYHAAPPYPHAPRPHSPQPHASPPQTAQSNPPGSPPPRTAPTSARPRSGTDGPRD